MGQSVIVFNGTGTPITMYLNGGTTAYKLSAAAQGFQWFPMAAVPVPPFSADGSIQDSFGYGLNNVTLMPGTGGGAPVTQITVPETVNPAQQLVMYLFYRDADTAAWVLLADGTPVASGPATAWTST